MLKDNKNNDHLNRRSQIWMASIFSWLCRLTILSAFIGLMLFLTTGEQFTFIRLFSYVSSVLGGLMLIMALPTILLQKKILGFSFLFLAMSLGLPNLSLFNSKKVDIGDSRSYKVMTFSKMGRNHNIDAVAQVVLNEKPDILFMQEITEQEAKKLIQLANGIYDGAPIFYFADAYYGLILSRYKVTSLQKKGDFSQTAEIELPEKPVRVWNVHLQKSFGNTDLQYEMTNQLSEQIASANSPVIVGGDFNATIINYPYKKIKQHLDNAFENAGVGFGFTFPSKARRLGVFAPFMRIDHIFYSSQFNIHKSYVVEQSGESDHYPVVAILSLKKDNV